MKFSLTSPLVTSLCLRIGLAFTFAYAGVDALIEPDVWIGFMPPFLMGVIPDKLLLDGFSLSQLVLAAAILWRKTSAYAGMVSALLLAGITLTSFGQMLIVFRDIGLAAMALALASHDWEHRLRVLKPAPSGKRRK